MSRCSKRDADFPLPLHFVIWMVILLSLFHSVLFVRSAFFQRYIVVIVVGGKERRVWVGCQCTFSFRHF